MVCCRTRWSFPLLLKMLFNCVYERPNVWEGVIRQRGMKKSLYSSEPSLGVLGEVLSPTELQWVAEATPPQNVAGVGGPLLSAIQVSALTEERTLNELGCTHAAEENQTCVLFKESQWQMDLSWVWARKVISGIDMLCEWGVLLFSMRKSTRIKGLARKGPRLKISRVCLVLG